MIPFLKDPKQSLVFVTLGERQLTAHEAAKSADYDDRFRGFQVVEAV